MSPCFPLWSVFSYFTPLNCLEKEKGRILYRKKFDQSEQTNSWVPFGRYKTSLKGTNLQEVRGAREEGEISRCSLTHLHAVEDQQKESALAMHRERLAICYGLISTKRNTTLRVVERLESMQWLPLNDQADR